MREKWTRMPLALGLEKTIMVLSDTRQLTMLGNSKNAISAWIRENYHGIVGHKTVDNA